MASFILRSGFQTAKVPMFPRSIRRIASTVTAESNDRIIWNKARPYEEIPGPKPFPVVGNLFQFIPGIGIMGEKDTLIHQRQLMNKYGKIVKVSRIPGRRDMVFVFDPKYFEEMYRNEGQWPARDGVQSLTYYRKVHRKEFFQGVGGLLTEFGEDWKKFRTKVNPPMIHPGITHMYLRPIIEVSNEFIERTKSIRDEKGETPHDYLNELNKWALESITMIALDKRLGCLESNMSADSDNWKMINASDNFLKCVEILETRLPLWKIISTPTWRRFVKSLDCFTEVAMKNIYDALKKLQERKLESNYEPSVLEKILLRDPDPKTACVMALDMMIAGVDTTSFNVASMLYHLSKNPDKQEHLFKELLKFLPNPSDEITAEIIEDMKYFKCCMKESMRLSGVAGLNMRATVKDTVIGNYRIPPNVNVILPHLLAGQLDENFPLASRYIPERWLKSRPNGDSESFGSPEDFDKTKAFKTNPFTFMPFGFGPRICIGKRFAVLELTILMIKMIRNFQVEYNYGEMEYDTQLAHKPLSPLKFKLTDRII